MIGKIFFLTNRFFNLYNFEKLASIGTPLVALLTPEMARASEDKLKYFNQVHILNTVKYGLNSRIDYSCLEPVLIREVEGADPTTTRIICNDDVHMPLAGLLRQNLGIPGHQLEVCLNFSDKLQSKSVLQRAGVKTPRFEAFSHSKWLADCNDYFDELVSTYKLPFVVKPTNCASSLGFKVIHNYTDFMTIPSMEGQDCEIEEFLRGTLFHCDSLTKDGETIFSACSRYNRPMGEFLQGIPIGSLVVPDSEAIAERIKEFAQVVVRTLGLLNGASHLEVFEEDGELTFLEVAMRCPGGFAVPAYEKMYGLDMLENDFNIQTGRPIDRPTASKAHAFWMMFPRLGGEVVTYRPPTIESESYIKWNCSPGDRLAPSISLAETTAIFLGWTTSYDQAKYDFEQLEKLQLVELRSLTPRSAYTQADTVRRALEKSPRSVRDIEESITNE
ncbi:MAG: ATP-grasp domain-containing protein [Gammaproteobacteria bacterium]|nr:ATP-grasp domain-containing protein [Gammaproteobacteria bacterium]